MKGNQGRTWRQELKQRSWRDTAHCLAPHRLLSLLSFTIQEHPAQGCHHPQWAGCSHVDHWSQAWLQANVKVACSQLRCLFPDDHRLRQVDKKQTSTQILPHALKKFLMYKSKTQIQKLFILSFSLVLDFDFIMNMLFELSLCLPLKGVLCIGGWQAEFYFILKGTAIIIYN